MKVTNLTPIYQKEIIWFLQDRFQIKNVEHPYKKNENVLISQRVFVFFFCYLLPAF